jgi:DNA-binding CsgD family transcriptional regulator
MESCQEVDGLLRRRALGMAPTQPDLMSQLPLELFDEIEFGLMVCDGDGQLRFTNQAASRELLNASLLLRSDGCLRQAPGTSGNLYAALRLAAQRARRSLVRMVRDGDRLMASVLPFGPSQADGQHVLVMLGRRQPCSELGLEMLATSYGLTLAERRVLAALVREASPREIAAQHAVALSTVRTQIQSIRTKLGARNVEGLLLRAAEVPPVTSALRAAFGGRAPMLAAA